jgi:Ni/Co efflux regulator RcnB
MKKTIATLVSLFVLSMTALPLAAQTRSRCSNTRTAYDSRYSSGHDDRRYDNQYSTNVYGNDTYRDNSYNNDAYSNDVYRYGRGRSVWDKHRDKITTAGGAVGGALLGGLIGGKKGAVIGAITGGAGAAIYAYKVRDRYRRY